MTFATERFDFVGRLSIAAIGVVIVVLVGVVVCIKVCQNYRKKMIHLMHVGNLAKIEEDEERMDLGDDIGEEEMKQIEGIQAVYDVRKLWESDSEIDETW
jgi:hypothetical protein